MLTPVMSGTWSAAEVAAAVDNDALAGDEARLLGYEEAHRVCDVVRCTHPARGHRCKIGVPHLRRDIGMALNGDEARRDGIHRDAEGCQLTSPAAGETDLRALRGGIGRPAWGRPVRDLRVDVDDAPEPPRLHSGDDRASEQHRALDEESELGEVILPGHLGQRGFWLRAGGVEHQHVKGPQAISHRVYQFGHLLLISDVGAEGIGDTAVGPDDAGDLNRLCVATDAVDRDRKAVAGKPLHDRAAQSPRATRDQSDPLGCDIHWRSITATRGGSTIITTVLRTLINDVDFGMSLPEAIAAPRVSQRNTATSTAEADFYNSALAQQLTTQYGEKFTLQTGPVLPHDQWIGAATGIQFLPGGVFQAAAEPVRLGGGSALVVTPQ
jgi:Gamma-glutamyltranspeptidase